MILWEISAKVLDISSAIGWAAPNLWKSLPVLLDTSVKRSAVEWKDLKPYYNFGKGTHFLMWLTSTLFGSTLFYYPQKED